MGLPLFASPYPPGLGARRHPRKRNTAKKKDLAPWAQVVAGKYLALIPTPAKRKRIGSPHLSRRLTK